MSILASILLGFVQGITEFIPVSSSGHLVIIGESIDLGNHFEFDVLLNIGTIGALVVYTRKRLVEIARKTLKGNWSLLIKLAVVSVPAAVIGLLLGEQIEDLNTNTHVVAVMLLLVGCVMLVVGEKTKALKHVEDIPWSAVVLIGCAQAVALIPGTSRSGITILAGLMMGLKRSTAAEWSFLMAIPIISGATLKVLLSRDGIDLLANNFGAVVVGNMASFLVGLVAIGFLLKVLRTNTLRPFGVYRIGLGLVLLFALGANIL